MVQFFPIFFRFHLVTIEYNVISKSLKLNEYVLMSYFRSIRCPFSCANLSYNGYYKKRKLDKDMLQKVFCIVSMIKAVESKCLLFINFLTRHKTDFLLLCDFQRTRNFTLLVLAGNCQKWQLLEQIKNCHYHWESKYKSVKVRKWFQ